MKRLMKPIAEFMSEMSQPPQEVTSQGKCHSSIRRGVKSNSKPLSCDTEQITRLSYKIAHWAAQGYL